MKTAGWIFWLYLDHLLRNPRGRTCAKFCIDVEVADVELDVCQTFGDPLKCVDSVRSRILSLL